MGKRDEVVALASVSLAFLKERSFVTVHHRHCYPASNFLVEDALLTFQCLDA